MPGSRWWLRRASLPRSADDGGSAPLEPKQWHILRAERNDLAEPFEVS
jgi:hypothetical protein